MYSTLDTLTHLLHDLLVLGEGLLQHQRAARLVTDRVQKQFSFCQKNTEPVVKCFLLVRILKGLKNLKQNFYCWSDYQMIDRLGPEPAGGHSVLLRPVVPRILLGPINIFYRKCT